MLQLAAAMGAGFMGSATPPANYELTEYGFDNPTLGFTPSRKRRNKTSEPSQRQVRKNRRRANAAGVKNAFKR